jgi:hypothetical protein
MNYPVTHRQSIDGHPCWPFRWPHERDSGDTAGEQWRPIPAYEGYYEVSNLGSVRSLARVVPSTARGGKRTVHARILKVTADRDGYPLVTLTKHSRYKLVPVHRLVALAFHGPCPDGLECAHLDGNRANPRADNPTWATKAENEAHKYLHGTRQARAEGIARRMTHD